MKREGDPVAEVVGTIKGLGDGFMRLERMKMDMAREVKAMQRDMEMKWTEMLLESQERIVEFFEKALSEKRNKKAKRMPTPKA
ncbi:Protein FIP2 [Camellia lanceoleosa]|uniref:Protein FIP2 n=1 Tax=Camellia lanceoleosa TaxID=1840588 RepID=A0ACC0IJ91_9ERIC|nr:Protein FIP2 [Camellia lanceoleosa]